MRCWLLALLVACDGTPKTPAAPATPVAPTPTVAATPVVKRALSTNSFVLPTAADVIAVAPGGDFVAAASDFFAGIAGDHPLVVWDSAGVERYRTSDVSDAVFDAKGTMLLVARRDESIEIIDAQTWKSRGMVPACRTR